VFLTYLVLYGRRGCFGRRGSGCVYPIRFDCGCFLRLLFFMLVQNGLQPLPVGVIWSIATLVGRLLWNGWLG
jgi:hypothetical protein